MTILNLEKPTLSQVNALDDNHAGLFFCCYLINTSIPSTTTHLHNTFTNSNSHANPRVDIGRAWTLIYTNTEIITKLGHKHGWEHINKYMHT